MRAFCLLLFLSIGLFDVWGKVGQEELARSVGSEFPVVQWRNQSGAGLASKNLRRRLTEAKGKRDETRLLWKALRQPVPDRPDLRPKIPLIRREVWSIPLIAIGSLSLFLIISFEIYVLCKARRHARRHLFLGQILLFSLFLSSSVALVFALSPSLPGCVVTRLGLGVSYTLIFSVLLVKCLFLISLDSGVYLPASYQAFLLFFAVLVEVVIEVQATVANPPQSKNVPLFGAFWAECGTSFMDLLSRLSYNAFLIFLVGILALKARGIRENYRESTYIGFSIAITLPIWISWIVAGYILQGRHQDGCIAFGLLTQSVSTFLVMFLPKGRQLAAMGKEGLYLEDQEEEFSRYSPSFFHFKPTSKSYKAALITDGNLYTTLEPTISTINPNVFFQRSDFRRGHGHPGHGLFY